MAIWVDIIIPVYNKASTIRRCIESVLSQTYSNYKVIIVDDGSTDDSFRICMSYKNDRVKIISQKNQGVGLARNIALEYLTGDKVVFIDADDYVSPSYIADLLKYKEYDLVVQGYISCSEDNSLYSKRIPKSIIINQNEFKEVLFDGKFFKFLTMPWNKLFDTRIIKEKKIRFREINRGEDTCFVFDYIQWTSSVIFTREANYYYVQSFDSLSRREISDVWEKQKEINEYCRKNFYSQYDKIWTNMYMKAVKRTLGEAATNKNKFSDQILKICLDEDFNKVKLRYINGMMNKVIFLLLKTRNKILLSMIFYLS